MKILAPCKINLFLEVKNKRADGYHNIESIMVPVSLFDELEFKKAKEGISLSCSCGSIPVDDRNLVIRAARRLQDELKVKEGAKITLTKNIPVGAGLGGGSSDAAATLKCLLKLWKKRISRKKLMTIASSIGADVPFFINNRIAMVKGVGEKILPLKYMEKIYFVIVYPGFEVSTGWAYNNLGFPLTNRRKIHKIKSLLESGKGSDEWGLYLYNRLEGAVFQKYPKISLIKEKIRSMGYLSLMSGSGSSIFGVVPSRRAGERLRKRLAPLGLKAWVVESVSSV